MRRKSVPGISKINHKAQQTSCYCFDTIMHQLNLIAQFYRLRWEFHSITQSRRDRNKPSLHLTNVSVVSYTLDLPHVKKKNCSITDSCHGKFFPSKERLREMALYFIVLHRGMLFFGSIFFRKSCLIRPVIFPFLLNQSPGWKAVFHLVTLLYGQKCLLFICWIE